MRIDYPIAIDNDFAMWRAFDNEYWPALYFVDSGGRIRHHQFGEGDYARSEAVIGQLLSAAGNRVTGREPSAVAATGIEAAADWDDLQSPETYLGYQKTQNFASPGGAAPDKRQRYEAPAKLGLNGWALGGVWTVKAGAAVLNEAGGRVAYRFHARDLNLVMGPPAPGKSVRFRVLIDGRPPRGAHGVDVDDDGFGTITQPRLYQLIRQPKPIVDRRVEVEFLDSGVAAYVFTFG